MLNRKKTLGETRIQIIRFLFRELNIVQRWCCANEKLVSLDHRDVRFVVEDLSHSLSAKGHDTVLQLQSELGYEGGYDIAMGLTWFT